MSERQPSDILIIGGGIIGLSVARELHKRGARDIAVVEKGICGREASWAAAGMLGPQSEADELGPMFEFCSASRDLYPKFAEELLEETGVDIELDRTGTIALAFNEADGDGLMARLRRQREAGLTVETLSDEELARREPYISAGAQMGLLFKNDWQVENRKIIQALRRYAEITGIELIENTAVHELSVGGGRVHGVDTSEGKMRSATTILATGAWTSFIKIGDASLPFRVEPVRGQIVVLKPEERVFVHVMHTPRGYLVPRSDGRFLVGSTSERAGFDQGVTEDAAQTLLAAACEMSPFFKGEAIVDHWSGLRPFSGDGSPVIGEIEGIDGLFVATAHYRNGILLAPLTAELAAQKLLDDSWSEYLDMFSPHRSQALNVSGGN